MLTCCNTARGRVACGLGGVLIAALALACLWAFSPAVTAGDDPPAKSGKAVCPEPGLPPIPGQEKKAELAVPAPPPPPIDFGFTDVGTPPKKSDGSAAPPPPPLPGESLPAPPSVPPAAGTGASKAPAPPPPPPPAPDLPKPPPAQEPITLPVTQVPQAQPPFDAQDIKQLVAQLSTIRAERTKLDEQERQTIQGIKRKYQEQKHALEQLDRELRQLGITCDETPPPDKAPVPQEDKASFPRRGR